MTDSVVVVGAGPVGLTAALALRAQGLPVTVIEAETEGRHRPGSRAIFIHRETLEHLDSISDGLGVEIARNGVVWTTKKTFYGEDLVYERTYPPPDPARLPHATNLSQVEVERMLLGAAERAGVEFVWSQPVESVAVSSDGVSVRTSSGEWRAPFVIGADGARSVVRESIGVSLEGPRTDSSFVIVDVAEDDVQPMRPERVYYYEHPAVERRNVLLVPFAGGIRADLQLRPGDDPERFNDEAGVRRWIARVLPAKYADRVTWVSTYRFHQVVANAFVDPARRVLLIGEAAHLFAPFGARGLNSGVPDAIVAARAIPAGDPTAIDHFAETRRQAALYNRNASSVALQHMQARDWRTRMKRRLAAELAKRGLRSGAWLDSSPFGPRAAEFKTETGSY
jgi:3-(3-hydroxy-phenyl)propionate hydroxylase